MEQHIRGNGRATAELTTCVGEFQRSNVTAGIGQHQNSSSPSRAGTDPVCGLDHGSAALEGFGDGNRDWRRSSPRKVDHVRVVIRNAEPFFIYSIDCTGKGSNREIQRPETGAPSAFSQGI